MDNQENYLIHVMNTGFERAAKSFSQLINKPVKINNAQSIIIHRDTNISFISEEQGDLYVLVTHLIGEISGKSFLIFNEDESNEIFRAINPSVSNQALNEAFLLEIDNIISASVIAEISNAFNVELYGDVPTLIKTHSRNLQHFMRDEVSKNSPSSVIFSNSTFLFENRERVHPQFIWKISSKVFDLIPVERITA